MNKLADHGEEQPETLIATTPTHRRRHYTFPWITPLNTHAYIYIYANFIKHNRHFMPTYSLLDPFEFPYYFYRIRGELI